jgi:hypothetical protein
VNFRMGKPTFDLCCSEEARQRREAEAAQAETSLETSRLHFVFGQVERSLDQQRSKEGTYSLNL